MRKSHFAYALVSLSFTVVLTTSGGVAAPAPVDHPAPASIAAQNAVAGKLSTKVTALFDASYTHEAAGDLDKALNAVLQILRLVDTDYVATLRAGWLYYSQGRYGDSVAMYERAEVIAPDALEPKLGLMLPLMAARRWADAERVGRRLIKVAPRDYTARSRLAWICFSMGRYRDAEAWYAAIVRDYPSDVEMMRGLAYTYVSQGRKTAARRLFERVLQLRAGDLKSTAGLQALK